MNKLLASWLLVLVLIFIGTTVLVSAEQEALGTFKQHDCIRVVQTCSNCTYNNITTILYPNSSVAASNLVMTRSGTEYNTSFCNTRLNGEYIVNGYGNPDGVKTVWGYTFTVTPSGDKSLLGFYFLIMIVIYGILLLGIFKRDLTVAMIGTFGLYLLSLYFYFNGIDIYKNDFTNNVALLHLAVAVLLSIKIGLDYIDG